MATTSILIASYLEPEHVAEIERVAQAERPGGVGVIYEPSLLGRPRYACDHTAPLQRSEADERRWRQYLAEAEVLFDFDHTNLSSLKDLIPRCRWLQGTSTGIGQALVRSGLIHTPIVFTTARGIHARPLADFVVMAMLWFSKGGPQMLRQQRTHTWRRYCGRDLEQATVGIVGFGSIGRELAARCKQMGMRVLAAKRTPGQQDPADALVPLVDLARLLSESDFVVLAVPHTAETEGLIGRVQIAAMKPGAVIINLARGVVVDEPAMIEALRSEHLGGAALDVFAKEPLPADSPLWDLPNVLVCPHSASTLDSENAQLTELFCANLRRYFRGEPLINVFDKKRLY